MTALHLAAVNNSIDMTSVLLKIPNIEINAKDNVSLPSLLLYQYIIHNHNYHRFNKDSL